MRLGIGLLFVSVCAAQVPQQDAIAAMEASIAKQRAALEVQRESIARHVAALPVLAFKPSEIALRAAGIPIQEPPCDPMSPQQIAPLVDRAAGKTGLAPDLLAAVIATESGGRPCAVSEKGAQGLMQLMPETAAQVGVNDPFDPAENIHGGAQYLSGLVARYGGNLPLALAAYNAGPNRVDAAGGTPAFRETVRYVETILRRLKPPGPVPPGPESPALIRP